MGILAMGSRSGLSDGLQQTGTSLRNHVEFLASDDLGGRLTGTTGAGKAADYIIGQLKEIGATMTAEWLEAAGAEGASIVDAFKAMQ